MSSRKVSELQSKIKKTARPAVRIGAIFILVAAAVVVLVYTGAHATTLCGLGCVTTYGYGNSRANVNSTESTLKASTLSLPSANVNTSAPLNGAIFAQPLFVSRMVSGGATSDILFVATEENYVYALDGATLSTKWTRNLNINTGETAVPDAQLPGGCTNIQPEVGVTGTPVIDVQNSSSTEQYMMYVVSKHYNGTIFVQRLNAIDVRTGTLMAHIDMAATLLNFSAAEQNQRAGLALTYDGSNNPLVYVAWGSHCDDIATSNPMGYTGRVAVFQLSQTTTLSCTTAPCFALKGDFVSTPLSDGDTDQYTNKGGIWMSGAAPAIDDNGGSGDVYLSTGNGLFDGTSNFGESVLRLNLGTSLLVNGFYTPNKWATLNDGSGTPPTCSPSLTLPEPVNGTTLCIPKDFDLGSGGVTLARPTGAGFPSLEVLAGGKEGVIYALDPDQMKTNFTNGTADGTDACSEAAGVEAVDCIAAVRLPNPLPTSKADYGVRGSFTFWNASTINALYVAGSQDGPDSTHHGQIRAYQMNSTGTFATASPIYGLVEYPHLDTTSHRIPYPGSCLVISWDSSGLTSNAILWVLFTSGFQGDMQTSASRAELYAYTAQPDGTTHSILSAHGYAGDTSNGPGATKFMVPTIVNGYVYVAGQVPNVTCDVVASSNPCKGQVVSWH